jgi:hypothetical protein
MWLRKYLNSYPLRRQVRTNSADEKNAKLLRRHKRAPKRVSNAPSRSAISNPELHRKNKQMGNTTKEEFVRDAIRFRLNWLNSGNEFVEIPRQQCEELNEAVKEMDMPFRTSEQFINSQIDALLEKYKEYKRNGR